MPVEIERKYLVIGDKWKQGKPVRICQGYLNRDKERTVRVRISGEKAFLTIKGMNIGATRAEYEYEIPVSHAEALLKICNGPVLEKNRYVVVFDNMKWEVDEFLGENEGLIVAEVELTSTDQSFNCPQWLGREVTDDPRYYNSNLCIHPFRKWN